MAKGGATPAMEGWSTYCVIQSDIGLTGVQAQKMNEALWEHGAPALQRAFNQEAARQLEYVAKKELEIMAHNFNRSR